MTTAEEIEWARKTLGLGDKARLSQVKETYRSLAKKHHPDRRGENQEMADINKAYHILLTYTQNYIYSFKPEDVREQDPDYLLWEMVKNDPAGG